MSKATHVPVLRGKWCWLAAGLMAGNLQAATGAPGEQNLPAAAPAGVFAPPPTPSDAAPAVAPEAEMTPLQLRQALAHLQEEVSQLKATTEHLRTVTGGPAQAPALPVTLPPASGSAVVSTSSVHEGSDLPAEPATETKATGNVAPVASDKGEPGTATVAEPGVSLSGEADRQAYAGGVMLWRDVQQSLAAQHALGISLDVSRFFKGFSDSYAGHPLMLNEEEISASVASLNDRYAHLSSEQREKQMRLGQAFRQKFSQQKGVFLDAGAWYLITDKGTGRHLRTTDMARLVVIGRLPDGTVFDASGQSGQSRDVKVGTLLPALAIGLQKVGVGGHLTVVVPPGKGYGDRGLPPVVPGGATLIFDITVKGGNEAAEGGLG